MSKSTTVVTTTTALSSIADAICKDAAQTGTLPSKQRILNSAAKVIAGEKHDWGYLTGHAGPVIQKGMPDLRLADLSTLTQPQNAQRAAGRSAWTPQAGAIHFNVTARTAELHAPEMSEYLGTLLSDDLIAICEDFSTDADTNVAVQCMFEPTAIIADAKKGLRPASLWGAEKSCMQTAGPAYFASQSSEVVNAIVNGCIENWPGDTLGPCYKAFYMPHLIIISPNYFDEILEAIDPDETRDMHGYEDHDDLLDEAFQVIVDESLDEAGRAQAYARAADFLGRLTTFLGDDETFYRFTVTPRT